MIPFLDLKVDESVRRRFLRSINRIIDDKSYILAERLLEFEEAFADFVGVKYAIGVGNGTDAIRLALRALGVGRGDKVLTVSFTSPFTAIAILEEDAIPIFIDVDDKTWTIDMRDADGKVDRKTRAIVCVDIFGNPCDMDEILRFVKKHKLFLIEDACQAHGAKFNGKFIGSFGDLGAFSFYPTKNLGAFGDGGAVVTNKATIAKIIKSLRHGGQTKRFWHEFAGINSRLDEIQAAILLLKLKNLQKQNQIRSKLARRYRLAFKNLPIRMQETLPGASSANHLFVIRTVLRDQLKANLLAHGIGCDIYYPYPVHKQKAFSDYANFKLPVTERLSREVLALPLYPSLTFENQDTVIFEVKKFFKTL